MQKNLPLTRSTLASEDSPRTGEWLSMPKNAVKVCIQTQQGFARGLSDGLSKIVKSKENLRFISRNAIQNTFKAVTVRVPIGLEALNFQISKHRSFFFNVLVTKWAVYLNEAACQSLMPNHSEVQRIRSLAVAAYALV
ncbi:hypothetical protein KFK09_014842 [Dendrobium nobile]|uniref:Uncharacterized protein n=1 Tax=Dendrobium nobile TaxID=94219 RepID=A0A8T3B488_DENNO|nr:hypothetical protein KFK09_014842 [Dendrobium nobile]